MTTIERRVSEALRAYGEGLEMTTQDVDRLEQELELRERAPRPPRQGTVWQGLVAACAVTGLVLGILALRGDPEAAPPAVPPPVTLAELEGIWHVDGSRWLWRFGADGRVVQSDEPNLLTGKGTATAFTVRPAPGGFDSGGDPFEAVGCSARWAATISAEGRMRLHGTGQSPECIGPEDPGEPDWHFTRLSPVSVAGAALRPDPATTGPIPVTDPGHLRGTWLLQGTGTLMTIDASASYAVQDLGAGTAAYRGKVAIATDGALTFTSDLAPRCPAVYASARSTIGSLDTELAADSCQRLGGLADTWIRIN
ncbi:hypothetical protein [Oryzobacter telluris]|uniref:hypothetical protein n=1 Tax=Oryzobacter telluris TaxID=3149179 RepID=UPI00370DCB2C